MLTQRLLGSAARVGLGKTFIGMMLLEYLIEHQRKRMALIVPKAGGNRCGSGHSRTTLRTSSGPTLREQKRSVLKFLADAIVAHRAGTEAARLRLG